MIDFKSIYYKNFQSVGNAGLKIDLDRSNTTLLGGNNGAGKSTVLEALSYVLFGKALKKAKLATLINNLNKKAMLIECVFNKYGDEYKVVRGEKPKKFEIWKNGEILDQNAASKDYQAKLERILGMDHKLFIQVVLLNRERYIPFMDMGSADRRKVVEDILDINIFRYMNDIVKKNISDLSTKISDTEYERDILKTKLEGVDKLIDQAKESVGDQIDEHKKSIDEGCKSILDLESRIDKLRDKIKDLNETHEKHDALMKEKSKLSDFSQRFGERLEGLKKEKEFYENNDDCPKCNQPIDDAFRASVIDELDGKRGEIQDSSKKLTEKALEVVNRLKDIKAVLEKMNQVQVEINELEQEVSQIKRMNSASSDKIKSLSEKKVDDGLVDKKKEYEDSIQKMEQELNELLNDKEEYETIKHMLKDDGIKASIVDDYVGFINSKMNEYLNEMGFFINITLDGNFNETINSINKQGFTYENLSTGQKTRVNLAIWMVLLEVSAMKNSAVTNILFLDEILENLDQDGVSLFMTLVKEKMNHKNIFVITQRYDEFKDYFRSEIYFELGEDQYTKVV